MPVLVTAADEVVGSEAKSVLLLVRAVGDGGNLSTESLGPEKSEMSTIFMSGYVMQ